MKLVKEHLTEGVADRYLEKRFGMRDSTRIIDDQIKDNKGEDVGLVSSDWTTEKTHLYKNPISLENFDNNVRGILCKNGDLYLLEKMSYIKHEDIILFLQLKGYIKAVKYNGNNSKELLNKIIKWQDISTERLNFIEVERFDRTDKFGLGLCTHQNVPEILAAGNKKHLNFNFTDEH